MADVQTRLAAIEAKRAARKATQDEARQEQLCTDLEALDALEIEHGDEKVRRVDLKSYVPVSPDGTKLPTFVVVRMPSRIEFKRFQDMAKTTKDGKQGDGLKAIDLLASACIVYPDAATYEKLREEVPGVHVSAGTEAARMAAAEAEEEKKG